MWQPGRPCVQSLTLATHQATCNMPDRNMRKPTCSGLACSEVKYSRKLSKPCKSCSKPEITVAPSQLSRESRFELASVRVIHVGTSSGQRHARPPSLPLSLYRSHTTRLDLAADVQAACSQRDLKHRGWHPMKAIRETAPSAEAPRSDRRRAKSCSGCTSRSSVLRVR